MSPSPFLPIPKNRIHTSVLLANLKRSINRQRDNRHIEIQAIRIISRYHCVSYGLVNTVNVSKINSLYTRYSDVDQFHSGENVRVITEINEREREREKSEEGGSILVDTRELNSRIESSRDSPSAATEPPGAFH